MQELFTDAFVLSFVGTLTAYVVNASSGTIDSYSGVLWGTCAVYGCFFLGKTIGILLDKYLEMDKINFSSVLYLMAAGTLFSFGFCNSIYTVALVECLLGIFVGIFLKPTQLSMMKIGGFVIFSLVNALSCLISGAFFDPTDNYVRLDGSTFLEEYPIFLPASVISGLLLIILITDTIDNTSWLTTTCRESICSSLILSSTNEANDRYWRVEDRSVSSSSIASSFLTANFSLEPHPTPEPSRKSIASCKQTCVNSRLDPKLADIIITIQKHNLTYYGENSPLPGRYVRGCGGDLIEANRRWTYTLNWRKDSQIDDILFTKQVSFDDIKRYYPHFICGRSKLNCPVYYEKLGFIDLDSLKSAGVSIDKLLNYYSFLSEYLWLIVNPDFDRGQLVTVLDVNKVGMAALTGEPLDFIKRASKIIQDHYVERCYRMFIVNAPFWFSVIWNVVKQMLNENTRRKIVIIGSLPSKGTWPELEEVVDVSQLPPSYGGCGCELSESDDEVRLREYISMINRTEEEDGYTEQAEEAKVSLSPSPLPDTPQSKSSFYQSFSDQEQPSSGFMSNVFNGIESALSYFLPTSPVVPSTDSSLLQYDSQEVINRQHDIESKLAHYESTGHFDVHVVDDDDDDEYQDARTGLEDEEGKKSIVIDRLSEIEKKRTKKAKSVVNDVHIPVFIDYSKYLLIASFFHHVSTCVFLLIPVIMFLPANYHGADVDSVWCGVSLCMSLCAVGCLSGCYFYLVRRRREWEELMKGNRSTSAFGPLSSPKWTLITLLFTHMPMLLSLVISLPLITGISNNNDSKNTTVQTYLSISFLAIGFGINFANMCWARLTIQILCQRNVHVEPIKMQFCELALIVLTFALLALSTTWKDSNISLFAYFAGPSFPMSFLFLIDVVLSIWAFI